MGELNCLAKSGAGCQLFLHKVLHGFYVVVSGALQRFDRGGILQREILANIGESTAVVRAQRREFANLWFVGQACQPGKLNTHPVANQTKFTAVFAQVGHARAVAPVQWRDSGQLR